MPEARRLFAYLALPAHGANQTFRHTWSTWRRRLTAPSAVWNSGAVIYLWEWFFGCGVKLLGGRFLVNYFGVAFVGDLGHIGNASLRLLDCFLCL